MGTYKPPKANTSISALFWLIGSLLAQMGCMGRHRIKTSVAMEKPALAYQFFVRLMHSGLIDLSQAPSMGLHCHIEEHVVATM